MTIDEAITALERDIHNAKICGHQIDQYEIAIDTMRKYQKIQTIVKAWNDMNSFDSMVQIREVVEDGKID